MCTTSIYCVCSVDTSITLTSVTMADAGLYQCIANNVVGSAYATAVLTVSHQQRHQQTTSSVTTVSVSSPQPSCMHLMLLHCLCPAVFSITRQLLLHADRQWLLLSSIGMLLMGCIRCFLFVTL